MAVGSIVLAVAVYGIIRAIAHAVEAVMRTVIEIIEITVITAGSIAAVTLVTVIVTRIVRWRRRQPERARLKVISIDLAKPPIVAASEPGKKQSFDPAELFAEAVTRPDIDPRFIEKILRNAMEGPRQ